jgi:hypothetical protein
MNSDDALMNNAERASPDLVAIEAAAAPRNASASWDPHEIWLTRVKLPRDRAKLTSAGS